MPQFKQRSVLIVAGLFLAILLVSLISRGGKSSGISNKERALRTQDAVVLIDKAQMRYLAAHGSYSSHLADLLVLVPRLGTDLAADLDVKLDVSGDGKTYVADVVGSVVSFIRARSPKGLVVDSCRTLKSRTGFSCPVVPVSTTTTSTTTTSTSTTTTSTTTPK